MKRYDRKTVSSSYIFTSIVTQTVDEIRVTKKRRKNPISFPEQAVGFCNSLVNVVIECLQICSPDVAVKRRIFLAVQAETEHGAVVPHQSFVACSYEQLPSPSADVDDMSFVSQVQSALNAPASGFLLLQHEEICEEVR